MTEEPSRSDASLAFVDVITNGLGGLLVLFFIVIVIQSSLEWNGQSGSATPVKTYEFPFVIIARPSHADRSDCFDPVAEAWSISGMPAGTIDPVRGNNLDWGVDYAMLVAPTPLDPIKTVLNVITTRDTTLEIEVFPAGAKQRKYQVKAKAKKLTKVWPNLEGTWK